MFTKILIANRGEIACRVVKTARKMGISTVAVYSDADEKACHVRMADEAVHIGPAASRESYLRGDVIIEAAKKTGAQAIHPGYGFLSENAAFSAACEKAGIVFIGPTPEAITAMGLKDRAKDIMQRAGVPVVPGYQGKTQDPAHLLAEAKKIGFPILIKAVAGGGGKGMRLVEAEKEFAAALQSCQREAENAFGNAHVLIEKYITKPRHVEVQVFGDSHGNAVYLFERDCSLQRRHQKVVEEAPAPGMSDKTRAAMGDAAVKAAKAINYRGAGTIEFIADLALKNFYFMEMNTRLQVEHPVTEMITGQDLVEWQLRVAAGEELPLSQKELSISGHAFEVRLYAEDPANQFLPQVGKITRFSAPDDVRLDAGIETGDRVSIHYDPLIAKLIVHGRDRDEAIHKMAKALSETALAGVNTNQEFLHNVFVHKDFIKGAVDTGFIARHEKDLIPAAYGRAGRDDLALAAVYFLRGLNNRAPEQSDITSGDPWDTRDNWRMFNPVTKKITLVNRGERTEVTATCHPDSFDLLIGTDKIAARFESFEGGRLSANVDGRVMGVLVAAHRRDLTVFHGGRVMNVHLFMQGAEGGDAAGEGRILSPMPGKIIDVLVGKGDSVNKDQPLLIMEAMKMQMTIRAGCSGVVDELPFAAGAQVQDGVLLVSIGQEKAA